MDGNWTVLATKEPFAVISRDGEECEVIEPLTGLGMSPGDLLIRLDATHFQLGQRRFRAVRQVWGCDQETTMEHLRELG